MCCKQFPNEEQTFLNFIDNILRWYLSLAILACITYSLFLQSNKFSYAQIVKAQIVISCK